MASGRRHRKKVSENKTEPGGEAICFIADLVELIKPPERLSLSGSEKPERLLHYRDRDDRTGAS